MLNTISPPASPRSQRSGSSGMLPMFVQQQEAAATQQLLHPLAVVQQQQFKQPRRWSLLLQQVASRKATGAFYVLLAFALVWYVAAGRGAHPQPDAAAAVAAGQPQSTIVAASSSTSSSTEGSSTKAAGSGEEVSPLDLHDSLEDAASTAIADADTSTTSTASSSSSKQDSVSSGSSSSKQWEVRCPYGSLPGTWVDDAPTGAKWQLLDPDCQPHNWLAAYAAAATAAAAGAAAGAGAGTDVSSSSSTPSTPSSSSAEVLPAVNVLLLSDSVDRYVVQHVCDFLHGTKRTLHPTQSLPQPPPPAADPAAAGGGAAGTQQDPSPSESSSGSSGTALPAAAAAAAGPSNLNATAYAFHTCQLPEGVPLKLASSYFPGVHPTGPFHRGLAQNFSVRIATAAAMWEEFAGPGQPPHVVSVASALWDVARLWMHERQQLEGPALSRPLLEGWVANFSAVVDYSRHQLPQAQLWLTHTTMLPAHDVSTGLMTKPYLGRRYYIEQLNAAAGAAARRLGLQLVDYAAVSSRFREGQAHLGDLIHPNAEVALEVFNLLLNLAIGPRGGA